MQGAGVAIAGVETGRPLDLAGELPIEPAGAQVQGEQVGLAEVELTDRSEHPGRDPGRTAARFVSFEHRDRNPGTGQLPGTGESDQAGPDHDHVAFFSRLSSVHLLPTGTAAHPCRRNYPDQVQAVGGFVATLSARDIGLPQVNAC